MWVTKSPNHERFQFPIADFVSPKKLQRNCIIELNQYNNKYRLKSFTDKSIEFNQFSIMFFSLKIRFSYLKKYRVVCFRTCSNTLVPTYNYLQKVILVHNILVNKM